MKPRVTVAEAATPDGARLVLEKHDQDFYVRLNGGVLMSTRSTVSERFLAEVVARRLSGKLEARVLVGGLGFGFTLKELLARTDGRVTIQVAELISEVIDWNREHLSAFNGASLDHPRVEILNVDVWEAIDKPGRGGTFDAILLDVDNGASAMVQQRNRRLYSLRGLHRLGSALNDRGYLAVWSATPDFAFQRRLQQCGFSVEEIPVRAHERARRSAHVVYLACKTGKVGQGMQREESKERPGGKKQPRKRFLRPKNASRSPRG